MSNDNFTVTFDVDKSPQEVFDAINNVRAWWTGDIDGVTDRLGGEFRYRYADLHDSTQRVTHSVPGRKLVWHIVDATLSFVANKSEWKGTDVVFELAAKDGGTEVTFTHQGLGPEWDCYDACSDGWSKFIGGNLRRHIQTGETQPSPFGS